MISKIFRILIVIVVVISMLTLFYQLFRGKSCLLSVNNNSDHKIIAFISLDTTLNEMAISMMGGEIIEPYCSGKPVIDLDKFGSESSFMNTLLKAKDSSAYIGFVDSTTFFANVKNVNNRYSFKDLIERLDGRSQMYIFYHTLEKLKVINSVFLIKLSYQQMKDMNWKYEISNESLIFSSNVNYIKL